MSGRVYAAIVVAAMILGPYRITANDEKKIDVCSLVTKDEVEKVVGKLKEEPKSDTGIRPGEVICKYMNENGSWVNVSVYKAAAENWEFQKNMMNDKPQTKVSGLGDEAFWVKVGTTVEFYVRKGETTLMVYSSGGIDFAKPIAEKAFPRLK